MRIPCRLSTAWGRRPPLWNYGSSVDHWYTFSVSATARQRYSTHNGDSISWSRHQFPKSSSSHEITENLPVARNGANKSTAYIALGSNLGDRIGMIEKACNEMSKRGIKIKRTSSLWETEPMYVLEQEKFINGACEVCITISNCVAFHFSIELKIRSRWSADLGSRLKPHLNL